MVSLVWGKAKVKNYMLRGIASARNYKGGEQTAIV